MRAHGKSVSIVSKEVQQAIEFSEAISIIGPLKKDFDEFIKTCEARSEVCRFLGILLHIISLVKKPCGL